MRWSIAAIAVAATLFASACGAADRRVTLEVTSPKAGALVRGNVVWITGRATTGADVRVADKRTHWSPDRSSHDHWLYRLTVLPGSNVVRVTATRNGYQAASVALRFRGEPRRPLVKRLGSRQTSIAGPARKPVKRGAARFSPRQAAAYQSAQSFCYSVGEKKLARRYRSISSHAFDVARAYSGTRPAWSRQAVFEGCMSGFGDRG